MTNARVLRLFGDGSGVDVQSERTELRSETRSSTDNFAVNNSYSNVSGHTFNNILQNANVEHCRHHPKRIMT